MDTTPEDYVATVKHTYKIYFDWKDTVYRYCDNNEIIDELFFWDELDQSFFDYWGHEYVIVE